MVKHIIQNVDVTNQFTTGNDHIIVGGKIIINTKLGRVIKRQSREMSFFTKRCKDLPTTYWVNKKNTRKNHNTILGHGTSLPWSKIST